MDPVAAEVIYHLHHLFPQEFFVEFKKLGVDVDDYVMRLAASEHIGKEGIHLKGDYNGRWQDFFDKASSSGKQPTRAAVKKYLAEILNDLGLADRKIGSLRTGTILQEAQELIKSEKLSPGRGPKRGFGEVGGILFALVAVGSILYAISEADDKLEAATQLAQLALDGLIYEIAGSGGVGFVAATLAGMESDESPQVRAVHKFLFDRNIKLNAETYRQAYDLLFNTEPLVIEQTAPFSPAPAAPVWRSGSDNPPPPSSHKQTAAPSKNKDYPLPPPVKKEYALPPPVHAAVPQQTRFVTARPSFARPPLAPPLYVPPSPPPYIPIPVHTPAFPPPPKYVAVVPQPPPFVLQSPAFVPPQGSVPVPPAIVIPPPAPGGNPLPAVINVAPPPIVPGPIAINYPPPPIVPGPIAINYPPPPIAPGPIAINYPPPPIAPGPIAINYPPPLIAPGPIAINYPPPPIAPGPIAINYPPPPLPAEFPTGVQTPMIPQPPPGSAWGFSPGQGYGQNWN